jgi:hypothetical protein
MLGGAATILALALVIVFTDAGATAAAAPPALCGVAHGGGELLPAVVAAVTLYRQNDTAAAAAAAATDTAASCIVTHCIPGYEPAAAAAAAAAAADHHWRTCTPCTMGSYKSAADLTACLPCDHPLPYSSIHFTARGETKRFCAFTCRSGKWGVLCEGIFATAMTVLFWATLFGGVLIVLVRVRDRAVDHKDQ